MLSWARGRAGIESPEALGARFPKLPEWETGETQPTLKQLENFASSVHVPIGYLFLAEPPDERLPIPDFRTADGQPVRKPSPDLLDTIYACQERQGWYRDFATTARLGEVAAVGSASLDERPEAVASRIGNALGFDLERRAAARSADEALRLFVRQAEDAGILVMISGIVGSNTHRRLNTDEFQGFALSDRLAPLVFVNGADGMSRRTFTLAHELAHLWIGASGVSDAGLAPEKGRRYRHVERWCNQVAAELLVPRDALAAERRPDEPIDTAKQRLARRFKVSGMVILRRMLDVGWIDRERFDQAWADEWRLVRAAESRSGGGGDFYASTLSRVSRRFARALVESTLEGQTLFRDAYRMLGVAKAETFDRVGQELGVVR